MQWVCVLIHAKPKQVQARYKSIQKDLLLRSGKENTGVISMLLLIKKAWRYNSYIFI
jgi:hypothetical protein